MRNIVTSSGTSRPDNYTARALGMVNGAFRQRGAGGATVFDARNLELNFPGYSETDDAARLKEAVAEADAVVLASPEYHGSFSAMEMLCQLADTTIECVKKIFGPHRILEEMSRQDGDHSWVTTI